jgi:hypothetical protein
MAAMKPRTGDGPLEVTKEEAGALGDALKAVVG